MATRPRRDDAGSAAAGDRSQEVLEAATRIFQERGYAATTIQAIADEVGILKGSLYYYIDKKEDLLFQIVDGVHRGLQASQSRIEEHDDPLEQIRVFIEAHVRFVAANLDTTRVFLNDFRALSDERRQVIIDARDAYEGKLRELIVAAQEAGELRSDVDVDLVGFAVFGMMNWMSTWYRPAGTKHPDEIGRAFADLVAAGLRA
jgi:AcrR family transcriptional regulator